MVLERGHGHRRVGPWRVAAWVVAAWVVAASALALGLVGCEGDVPVDSEGACEATHALPASFEPALADELQALLDEHLVASGAPGATLTVHIPGEGTFAAGTGLSDVAAGEPMPPRARLRVGSITKTFVAAALLRLVEEGRLSLDDRAVSYLPGLADLGLAPEVTLAQLLRHESGIFNYTDDTAFLQLRSEPWSPDEIIAWSLEHPAPHAPGEAYLYSNTGFFILGRVLETVTETPLHELLRQSILEPYALADTSEEKHEGRDCAMSEGYVITGRPVTDDMDMGWAWAAGGMVSSGVDLCRWAELLYRGSFLTESTRSAMITPGANSLVETRGYGYATQHTLRGGGSVVGHTGSTMGFRGELFIDLESGVCVAVLLNDFASTPASIAQPVWQALRARLSP